ncbi:multifunctional methyltransferase subunit TRM112-like protein [Daktulosphaira vitifoliae]|uniref:multifunctional methyltransferase subunit TRM112-like protein n=1 Tax=Daktulosphaira vitifoliae TaxID=58002 RepID=UPI0021AAA1D0|nr:multifunctional methyltransferase subunit TRM112-like protein [Daktulosphaira vitifoliae]
MKLLTHNLLSSKCLKGVKVGYPLRIEANDVKISESEFNMEFIAKMIPKLDWKVLVNAAVEAGHGSDLPEELIENYDKNEEFLKKTHHILMEVEIINGNLVCPESGRKFPIAAGIPNLLLNEDESAYT